MSASIPGLSMRLEVGCFCISPQKGIFRPESMMEWSLVCCDDLTGLIVATTLMNPEKLAGVTVRSVFNNFKSKSFAAGADRGKIKLCDSKLGIPLGEFLELVLEALKTDPDLLGL